ncbi:MAG: hypothetical protein ACRCTQ_06675 [Brevinemataceae bacterium]
MQTKSAILSQFSKGENFVLSTSANNIVTSRTISVIVYNDYLYFTSVKRDSSIKNKQIAQNHNIALCSNKIQMIGQAFILGLTSESQNQDVMNLYKQILPQAYKMFVETHECYLIKIDISTYKNWEIIDEKLSVTHINF